MTPRRTVLYALTNARAEIDEYVRIALDGLRPHAAKLVVIVTAKVPESARVELRTMVDEVVDYAGASFHPQMYATALHGVAAPTGDTEEILFTGDSWFGPVGEFAPIFDRMSHGHADFWQLVENRHGAPQSFETQGFPHRPAAWIWTLVRKAMFTGKEWADYWSQPPSKLAAEDSERSFSESFTALHFANAFAFPASDFPNENPMLFSPGLLLDSGCPVLGRELFTLYPPFLHQHAIIGRDVVRAAAAHGYPLDALWQNLARTVAPKALNTIAGMLEIVPATPRAEVPSRRIAVVLHLTDLRQMDDILLRLAHLPAGYALYATTSDGTKAATIRRALAERADAGYGSFEVRVTPASRGRDMSDFFVACRDVIASDEFDLVVKIHGRKNRHKTANVRRYFRRYQWDNLLATRDHVRRILALFDDEPGLGMVFPPMIHIGYSTMGKGWASYRAPAEELLGEMGVDVPRDEVSPLAPYGAMWIARPRALRAMLSRRWTYQDYTRRRYVDLARVQERVVVSVAAEAGYHVRTVLTPEHAAISHTALEFKADQLFSTTTGYPVDQIGLIQRAGPAGHGGIVGLTRMYLRLNHPRVARAVLPVAALAERVYGRAVPALAAIRRRRPRKDR
ncbi:rhamnan synthesis F family protein [Microbacterium binotii]|uniref:rhamnan synthesis F family protein n=1 Tax=Microbacterium binotii TaxID=462710 RepID=UPI001F37790D|nr:rhamnan synthesis F family protein [Microbacterium binotii]UIN29876.1 hypothetical protein LXM64_12080 [Microbacterium binotii]